MKKILWAIPIIIFIIAMFFAIGCIRLHKIVKEQERYEQELILELEELQKKTDFQ